MNGIEYAPKNRRSLKAVKRRLGVWKNQMCSPKDKQSNVITKRNEIFTVAKEFYWDLHRSWDIQDNTERESSSEDIDMPLVKSEKVRKALKEMKVGEAPCEDLITADLLKDGGDIVLEKLANCIRDA